MKKSSTHYFKWGLAGNALLTIIAFGLLWWTFNAGLDSNRTKYQSLQEDLIEKNRDPVLLLPQTNDSLEHYQITKTELSNLNNHITHLANIVSEESKTYRQLVGNDIERLGIVATIIIGFISIFNLVLPIVVNYISTRDIQEKLKKTEKIDEIEEQIDNFDKKIIDIDFLKLKYSIDKIADYQYLKRAKTSNEKLFLNHLERIKNSFSNISSHAQLQNKHQDLKNILISFSRNLSHSYLSRTRDYLINNQKIVSKINNITAKEITTKEDLSSLTSFIDEVVKDIRKNISDR